jgi:hypothetical protein
MVWSSLISIGPYLPHVHPCRRRRCRRVGVIDIMIIEDFRVPKIGLDEAHKR